MKVIFKRVWQPSCLAISTLLPVLILMSAAPGNSGIKSTVCQSKDFSLKDSTVREVLTAQKLFVVKVSDVKKTPKGDSVNIKAELRDAFKIICYDGDSAIIESDWTRCLGGGCPEAGLFAEGTAAYKKLDVLIWKARKKASRGGNQVSTQNTTR